MSLFNTLCISGEGVEKKLIDTSARTVYSLVGSKPKSHFAQTSEYYLWDWEYAQTPEESSLIAASLVCLTAIILINGPIINVPTE